VNLYYYSVTTGKLGTDEIEDPLINTQELTEPIDQTQYSSIDSIKEDEEEFGPSSFSVS
jgi:hypothetical protein